MKEAGFIGLGFAIAVGIVAAIIIGIYFGTQCKANQFQCKDGYTCVDESLKCNGVRDCPIGDDEWQCHPKEFYVAFRTTKKVAEVDFSPIFTNSSLLVNENSTTETNATAKFWEKEVCIMY